MWAKNFVKAYPAFVQQPVIAHNRIGARLASESNRPECLAGHALTGFEDRGWHQPARPVVTLEADGSIAMMTAGSSWGKRGRFGAWKRSREPGRNSSAILVSWGRTGQESPEASSVVRFGRFSRDTFSTKSPTG